MPGRRNRSRELADLAASQPQRQASLLEMLQTQLPSFDRALIGSPAILAHLASLHVTRKSGRPLTLRQLRRWIALRRFPAASGNRHPRCRSPLVSTTHCVTAWLLTQAYNGQFFLVANPKHQAIPGNDAASVYLRRAA